MSRVTGRLTVFFEDPFWVGIFERVEKGKLSAAKVTFGAEPREQEVYAFIQKHYDELRFSPGVRAAGKEQKKNPKRMQREAEKQLKRAGVGTKSQQALKLQQEQLKMNRKGQKRRRTEEEKKRKFELKQQKKKEKHKGR